MARDIVFAVVGVIILCGSNTLHATPQNLTPTEQNKIKKAAEKENCLILQWVALDAAKAAASSQGLPDYGDAQNRLITFLNQVLVPDPSKFVGAPAGVQKALKQLYLSSAVDAAFRWAIVNEAARTNAILRKDPTVTANEFAKGWGCPVTTTGNSP